MTTPSLSMRGPVRLGLLALAGLVLCLGLWSALARLQGAIILSGQFTVQDNRQIIQHPEGGMVFRVFVRDGSRVSAGDPLLELAAPDLVSDLAIVLIRLDELAARTARLTAERDGVGTITFPEGLLLRAAASPALAQEILGQSRLFDLQLAAFSRAEALLSRRLDQLDEQAQAILLQDQILVRQLSLVTAERQAQERLLDQGVVPRTILSDLEQQEAGLQGQRAELSVLRAQTEGQRTETELRLVSLRADRQAAAATELREIGPLMAELDETRRKLEDRIDRLVIRAPTDGVVLGLQVTGPGVVLRAAEPILSLVPQDRPLIVAARLSPEDIDQVHPGQSVDLAILTFDARRVPRLRGQVTMVSADALVDPDRGTSYFAVEIALKPGEADRTEGQPLLPGMRVQAFLATGSQTPLTYLLGPFTDYFSHALRES